MESSKVYPQSKMRSLVAGFLALSLLFLVACHTTDANKCTDIGEFYWKKDKSYSKKRIGVFDLDASFSLQSAEQLIRPILISGKHFCLTDTTEVNFITTASNIQQPCFQLSPNQAFKGETKFLGGPPPYEVLDPFQFALYYKSIPKDLNKFLAIKILNHNKILKASEMGQADFTSPNEIWHEGNLSHQHYSDLDASQIFLPQTLHSFVFSEEDSFIYIYLPLNIGIQTAEFTGLLPIQPASAKGLRDFSNPGFQLFPEFNHTSLFNSTKKFDYCNAYTDINFQITLDPALLRPILEEYKKSIKDYLSKHPTAPFLDPYATKP